MKPRTLILGLVVVAAIAVKVALAVPQWRKGVSTTAEVPEGQAFTQEISLKKPSRLRLSYTGSAPLDCYYLSRGDHTAVQSGVVDPALSERIHQQAIGHRTATLTNSEFSLPQGGFVLYFEPVYDGEPDAKKRCSIAYTLEEFR